MLRLPAQLRSIWLPVGSGLALLWGFLLFGSFGAWSLEGGLARVLVGSLWVAPVALLAALPLPWRVALRHAGAIVALALVLALGWLHLESHLLLREAIAQGESVAHQRHWPFETSSVSYQPEVGVIWQD